MKLSVELSLYPLHEEYKPRVKAFIDDLQQQADSTIEVRITNMSTRVFGDFDAVTALINRCMKKSMQEFGKQVFVCKFLEGDARELKDYD